jgi:hypothetical protein
MSDTNGDEIARYLDGAMGTSERAAFEARAAGDGRLRALLDAERAIRSTISGQLAAMPTAHEATRASMMAALSSLPTSPTPSPSAPPSAPPTSPLLRWLGAAGATAAVVIGGYLVADRDADAGAPTRARTTAPAATDTLDAASPSLAPRPTDPVPATTSTPSARPDAITDPASEAAPAARDRAPAEDALIIEARENDGPADSATPRKPRELKVIERDSLRVPVPVDVEVRKD